MFMQQQSKITINGYDLHLTCGACPEQYDVYKNRKQVGYLRLRHGHFTTRTEAGGDLLYEANPKGDGYFEDDEREFYLKKAIESIQNKDEYTAIEKISEKE